MAVPIFGDILDMAVTGKKKGRPRRAGIAEPLQSPFAKLRRKRYHVQTVELTASLLRETWGNLTAVANILGITREAVEQFITRHPELKAVVAEARRVTVDTAKWQLRDALFAGEPWAIKLVLETLGKDEGFTRLMQLGGPTQPDGSIGAVPVTIVLPANGREVNPPAIQYDQTGDGEYEPAGHDPGVFGERPEEARADGPE